MLKRVTVGFILFLFTTTGICAQYIFDANVEALFRTYPIGAYAKGELGLSYPLWGNPNHFKNNDNKINPLFGYLRAQTRFQTSGLYQTVSSQIEFFPISFLGFYTGYARSWRDFKKLDTFDCTHESCRSSQLKRSFYGTKFALAFNRVFAMADYRWHTVKINDSTKDYFVEEWGTLLGKGTKDQMLQMTHVLGVKTFSSHSLIFLHLRNLMKNSRQDTSMTNIMWSTKGFLFSYPMQWMAGPGVFHDRFNSNHMSFLALIKFSPIQGLPFF